MAEPKQKSLNKFKFEANMTVFGTDVTLKPMDNSEIGYRAGPTEVGIVVDKKRLYSSNIVTKGGAVDKWIPDSTAIKTIIYDREKTKLEVAVLAKFKPGKLPEDFLKAQKEEMSDDEAYLAYLKEEVGKRGFKYDKTTQGKIDAEIKKLPAPPTGDDKPTAAYTKQQKAIVKAETEANLALLHAQENDGFILNRYPQAFSVNSVFLYLNLEKSKNEGATPTGDTSTEGN